MKRFLPCCLLLTLVFAAHASAQNRGFGLGIMIGEPTGITGKYWVSERNAIDGGLAWSFRRGGDFHLHADYLWHFVGAIQSTEKFVPYVGVGGRLAAGHDEGILGVRIPFGIAYWMRSAPIEIFLELAPILDLAPATELSANGGIGARFYFP